MIYDHLNSHFMSVEGYISLITSFIENDSGIFVRNYEQQLKKRRIRRSGLNINDPEAMWKTTWGQMLLDPRLVDAKSWQSSKFRLRFRVPYSVFKLLVLKCKQANIFGRTKIPYEFRVLVALRILARGNCSDDIFELSGIGQSTISGIFTLFCQGFVDNFYEDYVSFPEGEDLEQVNRTYAKLGFPGACGSMDVTHIPLGKCPEGLKQLATGKEKFPTLAFQCVCSPNRRITYCSKGYLGSYNDIQYYNHSQR